MMAFFGGGKKQNKQNKQNLNAISGSNLPEDTVYDALGGVLRAIAECPLENDDIDIERVPEVCEGWARHVLVGAPAPGTEIDDENPAAPLLPDQRDWRSVRRFSVHHRRSEYKYINDSLTELKSIIWDFSSHLRDTITGDTESDLNIGNELNALSSVIESGTLEELRLRSKQTINSITVAMQRRQEKHKAQLSEMGGRLREMRTDLLSTKEKMQHDALTGVYNRGAFDEALERYTNLSFFSGQPLVLLILDLDHFKAVNDTHGHRAGDAILQQVAGQILRHFPRRTDFVARYGGEEFVVILSDTDIKRGQILANGLLERIAKLEVDHEGTILQVTASIGAAEMVANSTSASLIERADKALYGAKEGGRNRVVCAPM